LWLLCTIPALPNGSPERAGDPFSKTKTSRVETLADAKEKKILEHDGRTFDFRTQCEGRSILHETNSDENETMTAGAVQRKLKEET
jgi:hypothetical protein